MNQRRVRPSHRRFAIAVLIVVGVGLISGCATTTPTTTAGTTAVTTTTAPTVAPQPIGITDQDNGTTLHLRTGQDVQLSLHSTYWSDPVTAPTSVLVIEGRVSRVAGGRCPIGSGCGTVSARFRATSPGTARLRAQRTSCGEARGCTPSQGQFTVTIVVN